MDLDEEFFRDPFNMSHRFPEWRRVRERARELLRRFEENSPDKFRSKIVETVSSHTTPTSEVINPRLRYVFSDAEYGGNWTPAGLFIRCMGYLHEYSYLPWWAVIGLVTISVKWALLPLVMSARKLPEKFTIETGTRPIDKLKIRLLFVYKWMLVPLIEVLVFVSGFWALGVLAGLPLKSMEDGGLLWFYDLTIPDQYYILALLISSITAFEFELGVYIGRIKVEGITRLGRIKAFVIFPITIYCPAAVQYYWLLWEFMTLLLIRIMRPPKIMQSSKAPIRLPVPSAPEIVSEEA